MARQSRSEMVVGVGLRREVIGTVTTHIASSLNLSSDGLPTMTNVMAGPIQTRQMQTGVLCVVAEISDDSDVKELTAYFDDHAAEAKQWCVDKARKYLSEATSNGKLPQDLLIYIQTVVEIARLNATGESDDK